MTQENSLPSRKQIMGVSRYFGGFIQILVVLLKSLFLGRDLKEILTLVICTIVILYSPIYSQEEDMAFVEGKLVEYAPVGGYLADQKTKIFLDDFLIDKKEVTVRQFAEFVSASGYKTDAEKEGHSNIHDGTYSGVTRDDINWRHDERGQLRSEAELDCPVIHVSKKDADEYAKWAGKRLPMMAELILVCDSIRGDVSDYSWESSNDSLRIHQGGLKHSNKHGVFDIWGNVSEWTSEREASLQSGCDAYYVFGSSWWVNSSKNQLFWRATCEEHRSWDIGFRCVKDIKDQNTPEYLAKKSTSSKCDKAKFIISQSAELESPKERRLECEKAVALCPNAVAPHFRLGLALGKEEDEESSPDYTRAEAEFRIALTLNPSHAGSIYELAGIEYVTGRFDSAAIHYDRFLALDTLGERHAKMDSAAERLSIKCGWLAKLPKNSFDLDYLREDPDRSAGIELLIGEIAKELGKAATEVTGKLGYEYGGTAIWLGTRLFSGSKEVDFGAYNQAQKEGNWEEAHNISLELLPQAIEKKGINSKEVTQILMAINNSGIGAGKLASELLPFALAAEHNTDYSTFPINQYWNSYTKTKQTIAKSLYSTQPLISSKKYSECAELQRTFGSSEFRQSNIVYFKGMSASALSLSPGRDREALDSLISLNNWIVSDTDAPDYRESRWWSFRYFLDWAHNVSQYDNCSIEGFQKYMAFFAPFETSQVWDKDVFELYLATLRILHIWGERNHVLELLRTMGSRSLPNGIVSGRLATFYNVAIDFYSTNGILDSAESYIDRLQGLQQYTSSVQYAKQQLYLRIITHKDNLTSQDIIQAYKKYITNESDRSASTIDALPLLTWVFDHSGPSDDTVGVEQLLIPWSEAAHNDSDLFNNSLAILSQSLIPIAGDERQRMDFVFTHLIDICQQRPQCNSKIVRQHYLAYYQSTFQCEKYQALFENQTPTNADQSDSKRGTLGSLFDRRNARSAIINHALGDYNKSLAVRKRLLDNVKPYSNVLPETIADIKTRIAETLAAMGKREESEALLRDALATFKKFSTTLITLRHHRAITDLERLHKGIRDIAPQGRAILDYER
jgi:tetratricopeptide (TPR) repeat protein